MTDGESVQGPPPSRGRDEAVELTLRAFAAAKASGREDWRQMTVAVLKNRLLDQTSRTFDEADWGVANLRDFVALLEPTVRLHTGQGPASAVLNDGVDIDDYAAVAADQPARSRGDWSVREDLWDAIIDHRSGRQYLWHEDAVHALEPQEQQPEGALLLPTVGPEQLTQWRQAFVRAQQPGGDPALAQELDAWSIDGLSSQRLPARLRNQWFGVLKRHVRARLEEWFAAMGIEPPPDYVESAPAIASAQAGDVEQLRGVVLRAVRAMTADELRALMLPASVTARLLR